MSAACPGNESIVIKRVSAKMSLNKTYLLHIKLSKIKDLLAHVLNKDYETYYRVEGFLLLQVSEELITWKTLKFMKTLKQNP